jgi:hypothetical protein
MTVELPAFPHRNTEDPSTEREVVLQIRHRLSSSLVQRAPVARQIPVLWTGSFTHKLEFVVEPYIMLCAAVLSYLNV